MSTPKRIAVEPEYITDHEGHRTKVVLPIEAYEALLRAAQQPNKTPQKRTFSSLGAGEDATLQGAETRDLIERAWQER